jgi:hypothetical protein
MHRGAAACDCERRVLFSGWHDSVECYAAHKACTAFSLNFRTINFYFIYFPYLVHEPPC